VTSRSRAGGLVAVALVILAATILVIVRTTPNPPAAVPDAAATGSRVTCQTLPRQGTNCHVLTVRGRTFRYSLARAGRATTATDLVDIGGPGAAPLGSAYPTDVAALLPSRNVLVIDEPWTTADEHPGCDLALTRWYRDLRSLWPVDSATGADADLARINTACGVFEPDRWALSPATYREVVRRIAAVERLDLDTYVGFSFGSVRRQAVADLVEKTILVSPFAPGADATRYLRLRATVARPRAPRSLVGLRPGNRSLDLTALDLAAAADETTYLSPARRRTIFHSPYVTTLVGRLADQFFGRYGDDSISHSILGYWAGTCPALEDWEKVPPPAFTTDPRNLVLRMCLQAPTPPGRPEVQPSTGRGVDCVAVSRGDGVTPSSLTAPWIPRRAPVHVVHGPHASLAGLEACLPRG
jgi:hypothetical protein